jgi:hypothetical protein
MLVYLRLPLGFDEHKEDVLRVHKLNFYIIWCSTPKAKAVSMALVDRVSVELKNRTGSARTHYVTFSWCDDAAPLDYQKIRHALMLALDQTTSFRPCPLESAAAMRHRPEPHRCKSAQTACARGMAQSLRRISSSVSLECFSFLQNGFRRRCSPHQGLATPALVMHASVLWLLVRCLSITSPYSLPKASAPPTDGFGLLASSLLVISCHHAVL